MNRQDARIAKRESFMFLSPSLGVPGVLAVRHHSPRRLVIYVETEPALGADEEPYSRTVTIPDAAMAKVSA